MVFAAVLSRAELCVMRCPPATTLYSCYRSMHVTDYCENCGKTAMLGAVCPATLCAPPDVFASLPTSSWHQALGFLLASDDVH